MERLSARPHHVGSAADKANAEWILAKFREWGWQAEIEQFDVLFPTPKERRLELVEPTKFTAALEEPTVAADPTSGQKSEQLPSYNAYSIDGDVTAPLVYVNYGRPEDYEQLDRLGISVRGAIVIARYGQSWRGIKPKVAAEHGAVGCLIYSDPRDDGYAAGDVFPLGPMRPGGGVQRGSVMDMPVAPGDPLTPGVGATPSARRLALSEATTLTKIPVLPISHADAQPLLSAIRGDTVPEPWRGALPITYHVGPGPAKVHLKVAFNWDTKPLYNVIARLAGSTFPDEWILRGQSPRRLGQRRRRSGQRHGAHARGSAGARRAAQARLGAEAHHRLHRVGRRGAGAARIDRVGRSPRRRPEGARRGLHQQRRQRPRLPEHERVAFARGLHQRRGPRRPGSRNEPDRLEAATGANHRARHRGRAQGRPRAPRPADRRARLRVGLLTVPPACRRRLAQPRLRRRGSGRHLSLDLRRLLFLHALPGPRFRLRARARADDRHGGDPAGRQRRAAVRVHRPLQHGREVRQGADRPAGQEAGRGARAKPSDRGGRLRGRQRSAPAAAAAEGGADAAGAQLRAARKRGRGADRQRAALREGARGGWWTRRAERRGAPRAEREAPSGGAAADRRRGAPEPPVVSTPALRARACTPATASRPFPASGKASSRRTTPKRKARSCGCRAR